MRRFTIRHRRVAAALTQDKADQTLRELAAATMVGLRVICGISPLDMAERMGYLRGIPKSGRRRRVVLSKAVERLLATERDMANARLSTYQRYARALNSDHPLRFVARFPARVPRRSPARVARKICQSQAYAARELRRLGERRYKLARRRS